MRESLLASVVAAARRAVPKKQRDAAMDESTQLSALQLDSLGLINLLTSLEKEVGVRFNDRLMRRMPKKTETLGDVVDLIEFARRTGVNE